MFKLKCLSLRRNLLDLKLIANIYRLIAFIFNVKVKV